jgi:hypothetical protein
MPGWFYRSIFLLVSMLFVTLPVNVLAQTVFNFSSNDLQLGWIKKNNDQWSLSSLQVNGKKLALGGHEGAFAIIYSAQKPEEKALPSYRALFGKTFVEGVDKFAVSKFDKMLNAVCFNEAGNITQVFPNRVYRKGDSLFMTADNEYATIHSKWLVSRYQNGNELIITSTLTAKKDGYYSMTTPSIIELDEAMIQWATVPGYFQGATVAKELALAYGYGQGIPGKPVVLRDLNAATLTSIIATKNGYTIAASAAPGYARQAWTGDKNTHSEWKLGLGVMNPKGAFTPVLYYPVLGQENSWLTKGQQRTLQYHFSISKQNWYNMLMHVIDDINHFPSSLALRRNTRQSLTDRIMVMTDYLKTDSTSLWNQVNYQGLEIGAQSYLGSVAASDKDAMKNSDYGAMWMVASILHDKDSVLNKTRLPYARNFKLAQQETDPGFFQGAAIGQYYLKKSHRFVEEWGNYVEPMALTYYTMLDDGNILLFNPDDTIVRDRLKLGADKLLQWQKEDGSWEVAYDRSTRAPLFKEIKDYRPTFYGMIVAYKILKDPLYLEAAKKGADWYWEEGIKNGFFLGVCGDSRFVPDFATAQTAQCYLDLFELTKVEKYKMAAIAAARYYISSIYTHPATREEVVVDGHTLQQWQIGQNGLSFEHGGNFGSSVRRGPILLAGHAGLFIRMFELTGDSVFINMARAGAIGRDAFVDPVTSVASYYWSFMNKGAGPFPHHAWWQIGWIMDYLLAEAHLRSGGEIDIPSGFITPKVGPHKSYGFRPGKLYGRQVNLRLFPGFVHTGNVNVEYLTFTNGQKVYLVLMNDVGEKTTIDVLLDATKTGMDLKTIKELNKANAASLNVNKPISTSLSSYGLKVYVVE